MPSTAQGGIGSVVSIWRHPVKSMMGEELNATEITAGGVLGDRTYAVIDRTDRKVASAKNPRKWPNLFDFRASFVEPPRLGATLPPVRITLPDGTSVTSQQGDLNEILSKALNRNVTLATIERDEPTPANAEEYWPDMEGLDHRDTVTEFALPEGTFFDCATIHVLTTATLDRLRELYPEGRFEVRRFRPNIVVAPASAERSFVETAWIGRTLGIGSEVRLAINGPCARCVMTTLGQGDLPKDAGILRAAAQYNQANVGVYATVLHGGRIRRDDLITLE
jgi:MOSC domain-containing protein